MKEKIFFSNHLDLLTEHLKINLLSNKSFSVRKVLFVPNIYVKNYLLERLAEDRKVSVAAFIEFVDISGFVFFFSKFFKGRRFPSYMELNLSIYKKLADYLKDPLFLPVRRYVELKDGNISKKRLLGLSERLKKLFISYSIFKKREENSWQDVLFSDLFKDFFSPKRDLLKEPFFEMGDLEIHLFSLFFTPKLFNLFLKRLNFPTFRYIFSPSKYFIEDDISSGTIKNFENTNRFLLDFGKLHREHIKNINIEEIAQTESYLEYENSSKALLDALKDDIFFAKNREEPLSLSEKFPSIQVHEASSRMREVEILRNYLLKLMKEEGIVAKDISILSPDIDSYLPYIQFVFGDDDNYKVSSLKIGKKGPLIDGIVTYFSFFESSWEKEKFFHLLENPLFSKRHGLSGDDISKIKGWIDSAKITWGLDGKMREGKVGGESPEINSWAYGIDRIFAGLIFKDDLSPVPPVFGIGFGEIELFEKFLEIFFGLKKDMEDLLLKRSLKKWALFLKKVVCRNFFMEEGEVASFFFNFLKELAAISLGSSFGFDEIWINLKKRLLNIRYTLHGMKIDAMEFASIKKAIIPKKVICLIGMDGTFPTSFERSSLNLLSEYCGEKEDYERELFLRSIISSESFLYFSYTQSMEPSPFLQKFLSFIDLSYRLNGKRPTEYIKKTHPSLPFCKSYFSKSYSFSKSSYLAYVNYYSQKDEGRPSIKLDMPMREGGPLGEVLNVGDIRSLLKNPLRFFLKREGIYLDDTIFRNDLKLGALDRHILRENYLKEDLVFRFEREGRFPEGILRDIEKKDIKEEGLLIREILKERSLEEIFDLNMKIVKTKMEKISPSKVEAPPVFLKFEKKEVAIVGRIKNLTDGYLLLNHNPSLQSLLKIWPDYLLFLITLKRSYFPILSLRSGKIVDPKPIDPKEAMISLLNYYKGAASNPSLMSPAFLEIFLKGDREKALKDFLKNPPYEFRYFDTKFSEKEYLKKWSPLLEKSYRPFMKAFL